MHRFCLLLLLILSPALASAALEFSSTRLDLKPTAATKSLEAAYPFTNPGPTAVKILDVVANCGCTVPELTQRTYAPGETGVLKVHFAIGDRQGLQSKSITVRTDAGDYVLQLVVDLPQRLAIEPRLIVFRPGDTAERTLKLAFRADTPVSNVTLSTATPPFLVTLIPEKTGADYTVSIKLASQPTADQRVTIFVHSRGASGLDYSDAFYLRYAP